MAKNKKEQNVKKGLPAWMGTYGDMVTLLLCFFILMFASSSVDEAKFQQIAASFAKNLIVVEATTVPGMLDALGNGIIEMPEVKGEADKEYEAKLESVTEIQELASQFQSKINESGLQDDVIIEENERYLTLSFIDGILFDSGSADVKPEATKVLSVIGEELKKYPENHIKIEGHTDNVPINNARYPNNWYLSAARAISVATFFINQKNFDPNRISTEGYGEYRPKVNNDTPQNRSINRRIEIKIISKYYSENDF